VALGPGPLPACKSQSPFGFGPYQRGARHRRILLSGGVALVGEVAEKGNDWPAMNVTSEKENAPHPPVEFPQERAALRDGFLPDERPRPSQVKASGLHGLPVQIAYAIIDCGMVGVAGALVFYLESGISRYLSTSGQIHVPLTPPIYLVFLIAYAVLVVLSCASQDLYRTPRDRGFTEESLMVLKAVSLATAVLVLFVFALKAQGITRISVLALGVFTATSLSGWRYLKRRMILSRTLRGIGVSRVLIVGEGGTGRTLAASLEASPSLGFRVCAIFDLQSSRDPLILGRLSELRNVLGEQFIDEIFLTPPIDRDLVKQFVVVARELRLGLKVVPDLYDGIGWRAPVHALGGFPLIQLNENPIDGLSVAVKRILDVAMASFGLVLTGPLLALLAALVRLDSPGPALYAATRVGYKARKFRCWKLRTMRLSAESEKDALRESNERAGPWFKMKNDPRVTRVGRWLRKFSLDELPQLWNVLLGDMSMVGPRPHPLDDFNRYKPEHLRRLDVKPGITGLWQVTARRDPSFENNLLLDLDYIENWTMRLDLEILFRSIPELFRGSGE